MRLVTSARARAVGLLLLEAAGVGLLIARQRHEHKIRREGAILDFAGRVFDAVTKAAKP